MSKRNPLTWSHPSRMGGQSCIRGTRILVSTIKALAGDGWSVDLIAASYPRLSHDEIKAALRYRYRRQP